MRDILIDESGRLIIENGDFVVGDSKEQHVKLITMSNTGDFKEFPLLGFGAINFLKSNVSEAEFKRALKLQLQYDGFDNPDIDLSEGIEKLKITI